MYDFFAPQENIDKLQLVVYCVPTGYMAAYERAMRLYFPAGSHPLATRGDRHGSNRGSQPEKALVTTAAPTFTTISSAKARLPPVELHNIPTWAHTALELDRNVESIDDRGHSRYAVNPKMNDHIALQEGDITNLKVAAIVNFGNREITEGTGISAKSLPSRRTWISSTLPAVNSL